MKKRFVTARSISLILLILFLLSTVSIVSAASYSKYFDTVQQNQEKTFNVNKDNIPVSEMNLKFNKDKTKVWLEVQSFTELPEEFVKPTNLVYRYINFRENNFDNSDLESFSYKFKVSKYWLDNKKVDRESLRLLIYNNGWNPVVPLYLGEEKDYHSFSYTGNLGLFAIIGKEDSFVPTSSSRDTETDVVTQETVAEILGAAVLDAKLDKPDYTWLYAIIGILILIVILFLWKGKSSGEKEVDENSRDDIFELNNSGLDITREEVESNQEQLRKELRL